MENKFAKLEIYTIPATIFVMFHYLVTCTSTDLQMQVPNTPRCRQVDIYWAWSSWNECCTRFSSENLITLEYFDVNDTYGASMSEIVLQSLLNFLEMDLQNRQHLLDIHDYLAVRLEKLVPSGANLHKIITNVYQKY